MKPLTILTAVLSLTILAAACVPEREPAVDADAGDAADGADADGADDAGGGPATPGAGDAPQAGDGDGGLGGDLGAGSLRLDRALSPQLRLTGRRARSPLHLLPGGAGE